MQPIFHSKKKVIKKYLLKSIFFRLVKKVSLDYLGYRFVENLDLVRICPTFFLIRSAISVFKMNGNTILDKSICTAV